METEQIAISPDTISLVPSDLPAQQSTNTEPSTNIAPATRNVELDKLMSEFSAQDNKDLMDESLSTADYLKKVAEREQLEQQELEKWKDKEGLSDGQRRELDARLQYLEYGQETRDLQVAFETNPNDPEISARYDQRQQEFAEYRKLMQESPEFRDNEHIQRMKELEKDLEKAQSLEEKNAIRMEMAGEMREFRQDLLQDPDGAEKMISFVERNQENTIIKNSGMMAGVEALKARRAELGESRDELENATVTPNGEAKAGAVDAADKTSEAAKTAESEVTSAVDKGDGAIKPVRLEGGVDTSETVAQTVPNERQPEKEASLTV